VRFEEIFNDFLYELLDEIFDEFLDDFFNDFVDEIFNDFECGSSFISISIGLYFIKCISYSFVPFLSFKDKNNLFFFALISSNVS
jgi:hypothetical protein